MVLKSGEIAGLQLYVYKWVYNFQDCESLGGSVSQFDITDAHPDAGEMTYKRRFAELVRAGLLEVVGTKKNRAGNNVMAYRTSHRMPAETSPHGRLIATARRALNVAKQACIKAGLNPDHSINQLLELAK